MYRQSIDQWDLGEVISYNEDQCKHEFLFPDGKYEMVMISSNPFLEYDDYLEYISNKENNNYKSSNDWDKRVITPPSNHCDEFVIINGALQQNNFFNASGNHLTQFVVAPPTFPEMDKNVDLSISLLPKRHDGRFTDCQDSKFHSSRNQVSVLSDTFDEE